MSFKGIQEKDLDRLVNSKKGDSKYILNLSVDLVYLLLLLKEDSGIGVNQPLGISVHSQGTCSKAIELFAQRQDVVEMLKQDGFYISEIVANQMEVIDSKFTGRITGKIITKYSKTEGIPPDSTFVGDNHDAKAVRKMKDVQFEFIDFSKAFR